MRMRYKTRGWLCSLIFFCAGLGVAQTSSTSESAPQSQSLNSSVSAAVNASANAGVSESQVSGAGSRLGSSASHSALSTASVSELSALQSGGSASRSASMNALAALAEAGLRHGHGNRSVSSLNLRSANRQSAAARDTGKPARHATRFEEPAAYSAGFADSTKGTALISPPDPGTASPFDWNPELHFGFLAFDETQFLNPTLQMGTRISGLKASRRHLPSKPTPSSAIDEQLGLKTPSIDQDILGEAPSTSIDQQLGLQ